jgi:hypothetical protein
MAITQIDLLSLFIKNSKLTEVRIDWFCKPGLYACGRMTTWQSSIGWWITAVILCVKREVWMSLCQWWEKQEREQCQTKCNRELA